jgi:hypothetical protein
VALSNGICIPLVILTTVNLTERWTNPFKVIHLWLDALIQAVSPFLRTVVEVYLIPK